MRTYLLSPMPLSEISGCSFQAIAAQVSGKKNKDRSTGTHKTREFEELKSITRSRYLN